MLQFAEDPHCPTSCLTPVKSLTWPLSAFGSVIPALVAIRSHKETLRRKKSKFLGFGDHLRHIKAPRVAGFSLQWLLFQGTGSRRVGFGSSGTWAQLVAVPRL